jgi:hypothetical protein
MPLQQRTTANGIRRLHCLHAVMDYSVLFGGTNRVITDFDFDTMQKCRDKKICGRYCCGVLEPLMITANDETRLCILDYMTKTG